MIMLVGTDFFIEEMSIHINPTKIKFIVVY